MIEYWRAIGRLATDGRYLDTLLKLSQPKPTNLGAVGNLYQYVRSEGYRMSRFEVMELNRVLTLFNVDRSSADALAAAWRDGSPPTDPEATALIGMCCIDLPVRAAAVKASTNPATFMAFAAGPPRFALPSLAEAGRLARFFAAAGATDFEAIHQVLWLIPRPEIDTACATGHTADERGSSYVHINPRLVSLAALPVGGAAVEALLTGLIVEHFGGEV